MCQIAIVKDARFALCRTKDRAAAILDDFIFPVDVDSQQMAPLIKKANRILSKQGLELQWTVHTLTVKVSRQAGPACCPSFFLMLIIMLMLTHHTGA